MNKRWIALAAAAAVLAAGYSAFWIVGARRIEAGLARWIEERRAQGYEVEAGEPAVGGFPFRFTLVFDRPALGSLAQGWTWRGERLIASAWPWSPATVALAFGGRNEVDLLERGAWQNFLCVLDRAEATLALDGEGRPRTLEFDGGNLTVDGGPLPGPITLRALHLAGELDRTEEADYRTRTAGLSLALDSLKLPKSDGLTLGEEIRSLSLEASLLGPLPEGEFASALEAWRDAGGTIVVTDLALDWGPLGLETNGTLSLDDAMRPLGAFTADITGYDQAIDLLVANDIVPLGEAFMYKIAFGLLAQNGTTDGRGTLSLPLTVQDGRLTVGPVTLLDVPPIVKPAPGPPASASTLP